jgi:general secretion pathway protein C
MNLELPRNALPLRAYSIITERNLFDGSSEEAQSNQKKAVWEEIPPAQESLGLTLVGTVLRRASEQNLAIIQNQKARKQEIVYEGDELGDVTIKKVHRHKVILATERGDELLTMKFRTRRLTRDARRTSKSRRTVSARKTRGRITLDRAEIESFLQNIARANQQVRMRPHFSKGRKAGIRFSSIKSGSLFARMGLRNGDIITGVNHIPVTSPEEISELYRYLDRGGEVDLEFKRSGRPRKLKLSIR